MNIDQTGELVNILCERYIEMLARVCKAMEKRRREFIQKNSFCELWHDEQKKQPFMRICYDFM